MTQPLCLPYYSGVSGCVIVRVFYVNLLQSKKRFASEVRRLRELSTKAAAVTAAAAASAAASAAATVNDSTTTASTT